MKQRQRRKLAGRCGLSALLVLLLLLSVLAGCSKQTETEAGEGKQTEKAVNTSAGVVDETETTAGMETEIRMETELETELETETEPPKPDPLAAALEQYRMIVSQAAAYDYGAIAEPTGVYRYALVPMRAGEEIPALLLEQETTFGISYICVFQYDADKKTILQAADPIQEGVAGGGGYRGGLSAAGDGNGLLSTEFSSGSGEGSTSRITLEGGILQREILWEGNIFDDTDQTGDEIGFREIDWYDSSDLSALDGQASSEASSAPGPGDTPSGETEALTDGNRIVFTGTLGLYSHNEVLSLQGISDPDPGSDMGETYWLIVLDTPQDMTLKSGSGMGSREDEVTMINVTGAGSLEQYAGQHLTFSIDADNTWWPSDTGLPLGQPNTKDLHVLE